MLMTAAASTLTQEFGVGQYRITLEKGWLAAEMLYLVQIEASGKRLDSITATGKDATSVIESMRTGIQSRMFALWATSEPTCDVLAH